MPEDAGNDGRSQQLDHGADQGEETETEDVFSTVRLTKKRGTKMMHAETTTRLRAVRKTTIITTSSLTTAMTMQPPETPMQPPEPPVQLPEPPLQPRNTMQPP